MTAQTFILTIALLGLIPAFIATAARPPGQRQAFISWWLFGALLFVVALPMALVQYHRDAKGRRTTAIS
jgi:hypothetical protein